MVTQAGIVKNGRIADQLILYGVFGQTKTFELTGIRTVHGAEIVLKVFVEAIIKKCTQSPMFVDVIYRHKADIKAVLFVFVLRTCNK
ncbi:MAG: hypothetical protein BWX77_01498 [Bacteroidetes bacterium ADurb.Bin090]|nr:MAG: hypothetical protein BWX77_01498 [Bacteroidetes bacterium ADurb.Bin090]